MLELRRLRMAGAQAALRAAIEREQEEIMAMNDRAYRKFVRACLRQRLDIIKLVRVVLQPAELICSDIHCQHPGTS